MSSSLPPPSSGGAERRTAERIRIPPEAGCVAAVTCQGRSETASVLNITAQGVGLLSRCRIAPGQSVSLQLNRAGQPVGGTLAGGVMHATQLPDGDFILGVMLDSPLTFLELKAIVG